MLKNILFAFITSILIIFQQRIQLRGQEKILAGFRNELLVTGDLIDEVSQHALRRLQDMSFELSWPSRVPIAELVTEINDKLKDFMTENLSNIERKNTTGKYLSQLSGELATFTSSTYDTITSFLISKGEIYGLSVEETQINIDLIKQSFDQVFWPLSNSPEHLELFKSSLLRLNYNLFLELAKLTGSRADGFAIYYPQISCHPTETGRIACNAIMTQYSDIYLKLNFKRKPQNFQIESSDYGGISWSVPAAEFAPLQIDVEFQGVHPYTERVYEMDTREGYFLFTAPE